MRSFLALSCGLLIGIAKFRVNGKTVSMSTSCKPIIGNRLDCNGTIYDFKVILTDGGSELRQFSVNLHDEDHTFSIPFYDLSTVDSILGRYVPESWKKEVIDGIVSFAFSFKDGAACSLGGAFPRRTTSVHLVCDKEVSSSAPVVTVSQNAELCEDCITIYSDSNCIPHVTTTQTSTPVETHQIARTHGESHVSILDDEIVFSLSSAPQTGWVTASSDATGQHLYAITYTNSYNFQIYSSADYGASWIPTSAPQGLWTSIVTSSTGQYVYAAISTYYGSSARMIRSVDYGSTWTVISTTVSYYLTIVISDDGRYVHAFCYNSPAKSEFSSDFGVTWSSVDQPYQFRSVACDSTGRYLVGVTSTDYIVRTSNDYGFSWVSRFVLYYARVISDSSGQILYATGTSSSSSYVGPYYLYKSTDRGVSWNIVSTFSSSENVLFFSCDGSGSNVLALSSSIVYSSEDYGISWKQTTTPSVSNFLIQDRNGAKRFVMGTGTSNGGIYLSKLATVSPTIIPTIQPSTQVPTSFTVAPTTLQSTTRTTTVRFAATSAPQVGWRNAASDFTGQHIYAVTYSADITRDSSTQIYASSDYGVTWNLVTSAPLGPWFNIATSGTGQYVYAYQYEGRLYRSTDYGVTWTVTSASSTNYYYYLTSSYNGQYIAAVGVGSAFSSDYGVTWTDSTLGYSWSCLVCDSTGRYLVGGTGNNRIYASADYGSTWTLKSTSIASIVWYIVSSNNGQILYGGTSNYVYKSIDRGSTWNIISGFYDNIRGLSCDGSGKHVGFAPSAGGGIYFSDDFGVTWTLADAPSANWQFLIQNRNGSQHYVAGQYDGSLYISQSSITQETTTTNSTGTSTLIIVVSSVSAAAILLACLVVCYYFTWYKMSQWNKIVKVVPENRCMDLPMTVIHPQVDDKNYAYALPATTTEVVVIENDVNYSMGVVDAEDRNYVIGAVSVPQDIIRNYAVGVDEAERN